MNLNANFDDLINRAPFRHAKRLHCDEVKAMEKLVHETVMVQGVPLVVDRWNMTPAWKNPLFKWDYLKRHHGGDDVVCRDVKQNVDVEVKMRFFLDNITTLSNDNSFLLYGKDLSCPEKWRKVIMEKILPPIVAYRGPNDLNALCLEKAAENLMLYIGKEGTRTPLHYDHCGTVGHNLLLHSDSDAHAIWFMIAAEDKAKAEQLFKRLGHPLDRENHSASVDQLAQADFPVYVVEQRVGDLILIPSLGYHQVDNMGATTIKVAWNRLTSTCLSIALHTVLPAYKRMNNPEAYRTKSIISAALEKWTALLESKTQNLPLPKVAFCQAFTQVLTLFREIVHEDWVDLTALKNEHWTLLPDEAFTSVTPVRTNDNTSISCDFCRCDIWNRYFHCEECTDAESSYDICTECFAQGRGCPHRASTIAFTEFVSMSSLLRLYSRVVQSWNTSGDILDCDMYKLRP